MCVTTSGECSTIVCGYARTIDISICATLSITTSPYISKSTTVNIKNDIMYRGCVASSEDSTDSIFATIDAGSDSLIRGRSSHIAAAKYLIEGIELIISVCRTYTINKVGTIRVCGLPYIHIHARLW